MLFEKEQKDNLIFIDVYEDSIEPKLHPHASKDLIFYFDDPELHSSSLPIQIRQKWSRAAFWLSLFAASVTLVFSLSSFLVSSETSSSSIFANAFDAFLGTVSSLAVAWRFRSELSGETQNFQREKIATLGIGVSFVVTGLATVGASVFHLMADDHPRKPQDMLLIVWCSLVSFLLLAYVQRCLAKKLQSQSMWAACADSILAAGMSFGILISTYAYCALPQMLWWLDHGVALVIGVVSMVYGVRLLVMIALCSNDADIEEAKEVLIEDSNYILGN